MKRPLLVAGAAIALAVGVALLVSAAAGYGGLLDRMRGADPRWLAAGVAAEAVSLLAYVWVLRAAARLEEGPRLTFGTAAHVVFAGLGASRVAVTGTAGAIALDYWAFTKAGAGRSAAASRVLALFVLVFGVFGIAAWVVALLLALGAGGDVRLELTLPWLLGVPALLGAALLYRAPERALPLPGRAGRFLRRALDEAGAGLALVRRSAARPRANAGVLGASLVYWVGDGACLWAALKAFGVSVPPLALALAYATAYLLSLLPLPLAGVGTVDAALIVTVGAVGVPLSAAFLGVLAFRAISFWLPTPVGIVAFSTLPRLRRRLERTARPIP